MHEMSFAEGIATAVVNPRIRLSVQLTNILICFAKHALVVDHMTIVTKLYGQREVENVTMATPRQISKFQY